jgi:hypothetical protein
MTKKDWTDEVEGVVAAAGLPWRVTTAWVEQHTPLCCAELSDTRTGQQRRVILARDRFPTPPERRAEIVRQLQPARK